MHLCNKNVWIAPKKEIVIQNVTVVGSKLGTFSVYSILQWFELNRGIYKANTIFFFLSFSCFHVSLY